MQQLEVFHYATALDINMGYYTIRLSSASQDMMMIVAEFGKFEYNRLPMGIWDSGDIFQSKVGELLSDIEGVKTYIGDILVLSKDWFTKHIAQMRTIFGRLHAAVLKVNSHKCSFGLKYITYLGYVIKGGVGA